MDKEDLDTSLNEELDKIKDINDIEQYVILTTYVCQFEEKTIDSKILEESKLVIEHDKKFFISEELRNQRQINRH